MVHFMPFSQITMRLAGPQDGAPHLSDFANVCGALRNCLNQVGRCVAGQDIEYTLNDLQKGSVVMGVVPEQNGVPDPVLSDVVTTFQKTVEDIQVGRAVDRRLDFMAIRAFNGFSAVIKKSDASLSIGGLPLTAAYISHIAELLEPAAPAMGSVSGRLETISIHNQSKFILYPTIPGEEVECLFAPADFHRVLEVAGRQVTVFGKLYYAKSKAFPIRVEVDSFEADPPNDELPTLLNAKGVLKTIAHTDKQQQAWDNEWE